MEVFPCPKNAGGPFEVVNAVGVVLGFQTERTAETVIFPAFALSVLEYGLAGSKEQNAPAKITGAFSLSVGIHSCHVRFAVALHHAQELPAVSFIKTGMICNQIDRRNAVRPHVRHNQIQ